MRYEIAKEKVTWSYVSRVVSTNCINKKAGHNYRLATKEESIEIRNRFKRMKHCLWICVYCNKTTEST